MLPTEPLELFHSWPIFDAARHFELGQISDRTVSSDGCSVGSVPDGAVSLRHGVARWACDLVDDRLEWSKEVYDLFGLPRGIDLSRDEVVAQYCEESRAAMERLRAYAIKHRRGFTLDAEIRKPDGMRRWIRLVASPVCVDGRVVRLIGIKRAIDGHRY